MPASLRVAPRFARIVGTGAVLGFVIGMGCGVLLPNSTGSGRLSVGLLMGLGFALLAGLAAGVVAVLFDRDTPGFLKEAKAGEPEGADPLAWTAPHDDEVASEAPSDETRPVVNDDPIDGPIDGTSEGPERPASDEQGPAR